MNVSIAHCHIVGITPLSQSRQHGDEKLPSEDPGAYDERTWRSKLNVGTAAGKPTVVIPAHGMQQAIAAAAKYSKTRIPGKGTATWTAKFVAGIALLEDPPLGIDPASVASVTISANADGVRGSGKRVPRRFPVMPQWESTFDVHILDPIITEEIFTETITIAGLFIGVGRFRPEKGGTNGRFSVERITWSDNRQMTG